MGELDWVFCLLLVLELMLFKLLNMVYYKNDQVDVDIVGVLCIIDCVEKLKFYIDVQKCIWEDVLWVFLVIEKIIYVCLKCFLGVYVVLDGLFSFDDIDIKQ